MTVWILLMFGALFLIIVTGLIFTRKRIKKLDEQRRESQETRARINTLAERIETSERNLKQLDESLAKSKPEEEER